MDNYLLYRSMKISAKGLPAVGATARTLGIVATLHEWTLTGDQK
jgi:hypothetical protein